MIVSKLLTIVGLISYVNGDSPWFCHGLECPPFTQLTNITQNGVTIDMRSYPAQYWASTNITDEELYQYNIYNIYIINNIN